MTEVLNRYEIPDLTDLPPLPQCVDELYPGVFKAIRETDAFPGRDMIDIVGLEPLNPGINDAFQRELGGRSPKREDVEKFVNSNFGWPTKKNGGAVRYQGGDLDEHGHAVLMSHLGTAVDGPTTIGSPNLVLESGGRYSDERPGHAIWYYWDTEPGVAGLDALGEKDIATGLTNNITDQIMRFRRAPRNANAPEYKRTQVAIYARLARRDAQLEGKGAWERHLPALLIEYWSNMEGADDPKKLELEPGKRYKSVGRMPDSSVLSSFSAEGFTYPDGTPRPRTESARADIETKLRLQKILGRELTYKETVRHYEEKHTGAGAGTDFADWMLEDLTDLATIRVTRRIPPFQNAAMFELECTIAEGLRALGYESEAESYELRAMLRAKALNKYNYHEGLGFYLPYDLDTGIVLDPSIQDATFIWESGIAPPDRAERGRRFVREKFLATGGLRTSLRLKSRQSWSGENVWPNFQRSGAKGSWLYGDHHLEHDIRRAFLASAHASLQKTGYGKERYHATRLGDSGVGGEYKPPDHNFSWDTATEIDLRHMGYRSEAEKKSWLRRRQIADGVGRLAIPN